MTPAVRMHRARRWNRLSQPVGTGPVSSALGKADPPSCEEKEHDSGSSERTRTGRVHVCDAIWVTPSGACCVSKKVSRLRLPKKTFSNAWGRCYNYRVARF